MVHALDAQDDIAIVLGVDAHVSARVSAPVVLPGRLGSRRVCPAQGELRALVGHAHHPPDTGVEGQARVPVVQHGTGHRLGEHALSVPRDAAAEEAVQELRVVGHGHHGTRVATVVLHGPGVVVALVGVRRLQRGNRPLRAQDQLPAVLLRQAVKGGQALRQGRVEEASGLHAQRIEQELLEDRPQGLCSMVSRIHDLHDAAKHGCAETVGEDAGVGAEDSCPRYDFAELLERQVMTKDTARRVNSGADLPAQGAGNGVALLGAEGSAFDRIEVAKQVVPNPRALRHQVLDEHGAARRPFRVGHLLRLTRDHVSHRHGVGRVRRLRDDMPLSAERRKVL
mmetsp:Transcript_119046/g.370863  ORF Transcript_119046/g.370863 Transcript_119046/m.370863 type:complete len:339 (+) Transcript_119046:150-1166(+)